MKRLLILLTGFCLLVWNTGQAQDYLQLGNDCFDRGDYEGAKRNYSVQKIQANAAGMDEKIELADKCFSILTIANFLFSEKEYQKAKEKYEELLDLNPKDPNAAMQKGLCDDAIRRNNAIKEGYLQKANDYYRNGDYQNAIVNFNLYKSIEPPGQYVDDMLKKAEDCQQILGVAKFLVEKGDYENAANEYYRIQLINPSDAYARNQYDYCKSN